ncbi:MAG: polyhydroxyalkanoate depolymerase [bacterium]|nr:polyhydroxyalkanoate depolymerase [bacterium]
MTTLLLVLAAASAGATDLESALHRAGNNRAELEAALAGTPEAERDHMRWLITAMPTDDLTRLDAAYLLENHRHAVTAWREAPWSEAIDTALFRDAILPYASVSERRDPWWADLRARCLPLVADATSPAEAAARLNNAIWDEFDVKYSTGRAKADQSPFESMESGLASCTGLSVLLIDACRSVGVPARFVGVPLWSDGSGNHSWVEIWDDGWHFTGAFEPSGMELDRGWFEGKTATAVEDDPRYAVYAVTWQDTPLSFPMVWRPEDTSVRAVNVTGRYARGNALGRAEAEVTRAALWSAHVAQVREDRADEFAAGELVHGDWRMPFHYSVHGVKPEGGRSLYISMHGGGGAPAEVNDQQWENQQTLYTIEEGVYLAPRAPTDTWNLWHQAHVDVLLDRLIRDLVVFEDVDPDRVYITGYSAGGDGVFQLAPRLADRLAAAAMMAGHPNETKPDGLRNLPFALHMGGEDDAYDRNRVAREWETMLDDLAAADPGGYEHQVVIHQGKGHWMDHQDAVALPWMAAHTRDLRPERIVWLQDDVTHERFYWLRNPAPRERERIVVERREQTITIVEAPPGTRLEILLDDAMCDLDREVTVRWRDEVLFRGLVPRTEGALAKTLAERGDPRAMFCAEVAVTVPIDLAGIRPSPWPMQGYACPRASGDVVIDGRLDDPAWQDAPWTAPFVDIEGDRKPAPRHLTRAKMLWTDHEFLFAAELAEPHLWATLTERDAIIFHDNDFEVFIDPDGDSHMYSELELNALNTVWDLLLVKPYRDGGPAVHAWDIPGLRTAVHLDGTVNDPSDTDQGWTVEIAIPWSVLVETTGAACPPVPGDRWRVNFSRVQWRLEVADGGYRKVTDPETGKPLPEDNWVWSPQREIAMHEPEHWGIVEFRDEASESAVEPTGEDAAAWHLRRLTYELAAHREATGRWPAAIDPPLLAPDGPPLDPAWAWPPVYACNGARYSLTLRQREGTGVLTIYEDGRLVLSP